MAAMMVGEEHAASEVLRGLARHLNCLNEDNKSTRKRALEAIKRETIDKKLASSSLQEVFAAILKPVLKCLSDPTERCRETAITTITEFVRFVPNPEDSLPYLIPCLAQRLGDREIREPSEELRLSAVELLTLTVDVCGKHLAPYVDDMINVLQRTIVDPFPDVRRESCRCTVRFSTSVPEHFHLQAESLVKPLMQSIAHQHSRVRVSVIEATGAVIQHGTGKNVDDVLSHLAQRLFDDSPQVRRAITLVVGDWLLRLRDRYSYFAKLIPLLLSGTSDEIPEIRLQAVDLWRRVGAQWEKENEDDIKDKLDFLLTPPSHYPAGQERPGLGCRELVQRNLSKLVPALANDLTDWLVSTRVRTSQLLHVLLLHAEDHCTQHLQPLLALLNRACSDPEKDVVRNCLKAARLLGTFVAPEVFLTLLLDRVTDPGSSARPWAPLMVMSAVLGGCPESLLQPHLQRVAGTLAQPDVCQEYQQVMYLEQLLACVEVLLRQADVGPVSLQLLQVLVSVQSLSNEPQLSEKALEGVRRLSEVQGLASPPDLYRRHMEQLLDWLLASVNTWSNYSPHRLQLHVILVQSGPVVGEFVGRLMPLLHTCLHKDRDPEMRMNIFTMLAKLLLDAENTLDSKGDFKNVSEKFLSDVLLPNLVWQAGRTAGAVRTAAISCVLAVLHGGAITTTQLLDLEQRLSPQLLTALDEDSQMARTLACRSLTTMLRLVGSELHPEALNRIYPELLKRLDDSSEDVRQVALKSVGVWFSSLGENYNPQVFSSHLEFLFQQLLLHLDDPDGAVKDQVLEVLKRGSSLHPALLRKEVEAVKDQQRSPEHCEQLLQHISSLSAEQS